MRVLILALSVLAILVSANESYGAQIRQGSRPLTLPLGGGGTR